MTLQETAKSGLFSITILVFIFSCSSEPQGLEDLGPVCFQSEILPLIQYSCAVSGCHDGSGEEGPILTNYQNILAEVKPGNARRSKLYTALSDIHGEMMPPGQPLSIDNRNLIKIWIEQGALNTTCESNTGILNQSLQVLGSSNAISLGNFTQVKTLAETMRNGTSLLSDSIRHLKGFVVPKNEKCNSLID